MDFHTILTTIMKVVFPPPTWSFPHHHQELSTRIAGHDLRCHGVTSTVRMLIYRFTDLSMFEMPRYLERGSNKGFHSTTRSFCLLAILDEKSFKMRGKVLYTIQNVPCFFLWLLDILTLDRPSISFFNKNVSSR